MTQCLDTHDYRYGNFHSGLEPALEEETARLTGVLLDRLTHLMHILEMNGESYRLKRSRESAASPVSEEPDEE